MQLFLFSVFSPPQYWICICIKIYLIWAKFSLYDMRKGKRGEERKEKVDQETWKKKCGVSYVLLSVGSKVQRCMLLWTKHRKTHSWNHAGLMEHLAQTPGTGDHAEFSDKLERQNPPDFCITHTLYHCFVNLLWMNEWSMNEWLMED